MSSAPQAQTTQPAITGSAQTLGPNLISNPSVETANGSVPAGWNKSRWSNNAGAFNYPVTGVNGGKGIQVTTTSYTSGDAKWYFNDVPVTPGHTYQFSDSYLANVSTEIDLQYTLNNGTQTYVYLGSLNPNTQFQQTSFQFTVPANAVSVTAFHLIDSVGSLTTDDYSLNEITTTQTSNLVPNGDFELGGSNGNPVSWNPDRWSNNTGSFNYPVAGVNGSKAAQVTITNYTSGDAKWYFNPVTLPPGNYKYTDQYISNTTSILTAQFQNKDGTFTYTDIGTLAPASTFTQASANFTVSSNVQSVTIFHLIQSVGSLTIDNASMTQTSGFSGIFNTGAVTLSFDDGLLSQYQNALPKLKSAGLKGTFYIISQQLADNGFSGYDSKAQVAEIANAGNEIGAHTRTHPDLPTLTQAQQQAEIVGSLQDLQAMNVGPITTFAYPYGDYNDTTLQIVKNAGFAAARSTITGYVTPTVDKYQLPRQSVESSVTVTQAKQWIDTAVANKQWLILVFHSIDSSGVQYSTTPDTFNQIVDYIVQKKVPVVTVSQGVQDMH